MSVLAIIPARGGSKRVPRKNLRPLAGKPLTAWSVEAALGARSLDRIVVSSDDDGVLALAEGFAGVTALRRPAAYATDTSPALEYVRHTLGVLEGEGEGPYEVVVVLQPSSPLTHPQDIDATVDLLLDSGADSAVSVMQLDHAVHPAKLKVLEEDRLQPYLMEEGDPKAAHDLPTLYVRNCAVYATRRRVIEAGQLLGADCRAYVMPRERSIDINEELDLDFAEFLLAR